MFSNEVLEKVILATAMSGFDISATRYIIDNLEENDFYNHKHKIIYKAVIACVNEQGSINAEMIHRFVIDKNVEVVYSELLGYNTVSNVEPLIDELRTVSKGRGLVIASTGLLEKLTQSTDLGITIDGIESEMYNVFQQTIGAKKWFNFNKEFISEYLVDFKERIEFNKTPGLPMGMPSVTRILGGVRSGEFIVVAARPSSGKSSFVQTAIVNQLIDGYKPALFSLEMSKEQITNKMISMISDSMGNIIKYYHLRNPFGQKEVLVNMAKVIQNGLLTNGNFNLNTDSSIKFNQIKSYARELKYQGRLDCLFVDQIGLLVQDRKHERVELEQYTSGFKKLAVELDIPIVGVAQISRSGDERPTLSDLKGCGGYEEHSNVVIFPYRPHASNPNHPNPEEAELIIAKSRDSSTGKIPSHFSTDTTFFREKGTNTAGNEVLLDFTGAKVDSALDSEESEMF